MGEHYETLGVARGASKADIKNAFFGLAHRYHPDHHPQADDAEASRRFRQAKHAYDLLSDDHRRAEYDRRSSSSSSSGYRQGGSTSYSNGHAGGPRTWPPPPPRGGERKAKFAVLLWLALTLSFALVDPVEEQSQSEHKGDERMKSVWRMQIADYRSQPTNFPRAMVSAWDMRNELLKNKWWMNAERK